MSVSCPPSGNAALINVILPSLMKPPGVCVSKLREAIVTRKSDAGHGVNPLLARRGMARYIPTLPNFYNLTGSSKRTLYVVSVRSAHDQTFKSGIHQTRHQDTRRIHSLCRFRIDRSRGYERSKGKEHE